MHLIKKYFLKNITKTKYLYFIKKLNKPNIITNYKLLYF